ncbi:phage tail spike protein [Streptococcus suis]|uniref:phage tail spike protein n=1 Tax=Streptococcus suis TaxID=1307 RepID=UPI0007691FF8|nr:phage tail spike protein [Streptococcus suis]CYY87541.1 Extracellular matrix-binding protein ebhB [Streptococcus suis]
MIYLFDKDEKLIKIVRKSAVKTALQKYALTTERYVSDRLTVELKGLNADELEQVEYMAIQTMEDAHTFHYFYVAQKFSDELTTLIGVQSGIEELRKSPVFDKRPKNVLARDVITDLLAGTNWQARFVGETTPHSTNFYYTSIFDALKKVCEVWDLEMQFFVEMNGNRIGARYIDFKQRIGQAVGKRVVYGHNALQILQEVERTNIFTALVGRGKGEETGDGYGRKITFENVVWSRTQGKPVDKPAGQKYLEFPLMTRQYGIKNADGSMRPKIGFVDFSEEENPEVLIERTYRALVDAARPQLTLKTSSVYLRGVRVGDTIRVVRHDKKLDYDTRIFEITFNRLNNQSSGIKLGDRIGESNEAKVQTIADKAVEQFITNEFSNFVQNLPDYLPSADGFNNNWYGAEAPTVKYPGKVLINDIWYKPDPEHEGHKIMLRWTGEVWEEILRTYESEALRERIAEEIAQVNQSMQVQSDEHDRQVADILSKTQSVEALANQAKSDAASAIARTNQVKTEAIAEATRLDTVERQATETKLATAKSQAISEATRLVETAKSLLSGQISNLSTDLSQTKEAIKLLATKATVDTLTGRVSSAEAMIQVQADQISQRVKTSNFDQAKQRISTAESSITQLGNRITTEISETVAKIPQHAGSRNYLKNSKLYDYVVTSVTTQDVRFFIVEDFWKNSRRFERNMVRVSFDVTFNPALPRDISTNVHFSSSPWYHPGGITFKGNTTRKQHFDLLFDLSSASETYFTDNIFIRFNNTFPLATNVKIEQMTLYLSELTELWTQATEDLVNDISSVRTIINQTAEGQEQLSMRLSETQGKVTTAETNIRQLVNDVSSKVSQTTFDNLKRTVDSQGTSISQNQSAIALKAEKTYVDGVKITADSALSKANANADSIRTTKAELKVTSDAVATKVSQSDFNAVDQRLTSAETTIRTQAGLIEQRLTSTQVDAAIVGKGYQTASQVNTAITSKGYQTKSDVDSNITGRGYITNSALQPYALSTTVQNLVRETTDSFSRSITETKALIPTDFSGGNLIRNGAFPTVPWPGSKVATHGFYFNSRKTLFLLETASANEVTSGSNRFLVKRNTDYTLSFIGFSASRVKSSDVWFLGRKTGESQDFTSTNLIISARRFSSTNAEYISATFNSGENDEAYIRFDNNGSSDGQMAVMFFGEVMLVEGRTSRKWEACLDDFVTELKYNEVKDTVDSHTRTIGEQGNSLSQVIQTAQGLVTRVNNLKSGNRNYLLDSKVTTINMTSVTDTGTWDTPINISADFWKHDDVYKNQKIRLSLYYQSSVAYSTSRTFPVYFRKSPWYQIGTITYPAGSTRLVKYEFTFGTMPSGFDASQIFIRFDRALDKGRVHTIERAQLEVSDMFSDWSPAPEDGDQTIQAVSTQVSTLAGSWSVKNLTNSGTVLNQLNLNKDGSVKIDGSLVQITGKTYIENGVIKEAMIGKGQIGTAHIGEIDAGIAKIINLDVSNIKGLDAAFIKAKIENAFIEWMKGKVITAQNEAMTIGLNDAFIRFKDNAKIEFQSENNTLFRTKNGTSAFIHFRDDSYNGVYTAMGVNADNTGTQNDYSSGSFAGVRVIRSNPSRYSGTTVDQVQLVGDEIRIRHGYGYENDYLVIKWDNQGKIDLIKFLRSVASRLGLPLT